jgi:hypothetical protein
MHRKQGDRCHQHEGRYRTKSAGPQRLARLPRSRARRVAAYPPTIAVKHANAVSSKLSLPLPAGQSSATTLHAHSRSGVATPAKPGVPTLPPGQDSCSGLPTRGATLEPSLDLIESEVANGPKNTLGPNQTRGRRGRLRLAARALLVGFHHTQLRTSRSALVAAGTYGTWLSMRCSQHAPQRVQSQNRPENANNGNAHPPDLWPSGESVCRFGLEAPATMIHDSCRDEQRPRWHQQRGESLVRCRADHARHA